MPNLLLFCAPFICVHRSFAFVQLLESLFCIALPPILFANDLHNQTMVEVQLLLFVYPHCRGLLKSEHNIFVLRVLSNLTAVYIICFGSNSVKLKKGAI